MKLKKIDFLKLNDLKIRIKNLAYVKDIEYSNNKWYGTIVEVDCRQNDEINSYEDYYQNFIKLGKELYIKNHCIKKMTFIEKKMHIINKRVLKGATASFQMKTLNCDYLILDKNLISETFINSIKKWCESNPIPIKEGNINERRYEPGHEHQEELDVFVLADLAIFSYLVYSSFYNYLLANSKDEKDQEEYNKSNKIRFNTFIDGLNENNRDAFLSYIVDVINQYERKIYNINNRPLLQETTTLTYNEKSKTCSFSRTFENIYSIFWILFKGQIYALSNNNKISTFSICRCGNIIIGGSKHCEECKRAINAEEHRNSYVPKNNKQKN